MTAPTAFVVFGAAVRPDGSASPTLARRALGAWALSERVGSRRFLVTGGQGRHGPPEANVMRDLLRARGVPDSEIETDDESVDTLESAVRCARILRKRNPLGEVVVVTSRYHGFRCWLLLRMLGIPARVGEIPGDPGAVRIRSRVYHRLRETIATPWDAILLLTIHRRERRRGGEPRRFD
jgi:vancomycin permeability regulator SanA